MEEGNFVRSFEEILTSQFGDSTHREKKTIAESRARINKKAALLGIRVPELASRSAARFTLELITDYMSELARELGTMDPDDPSKHAVASGL